MSPEVQNFIRVAFRFNLLQGYGLTETCSNGCIQPPWMAVDGEVGMPLSSMEIRLNSCCDAHGQPTVLDREGQPYLNTDTTHVGEPCRGRGEVWMRGPPVACGYYGQEDKTREDFDSQGWFHTGDIAIWTPRGTLRIVDRLKNLVKLKGGEYIAIEAMEATFAESPFVNAVAGGIMCYGDGDMDKPVALVQVAGGELRKWATEAGVSFSSIDDLCRNPAAEEHVCASLNGIGEAQKLGRNELLAAVALLPNTGPDGGKGPDSPWTTENQYLTARCAPNRLHFPRHTDGGWVGGCVSVARRWVKIDDSNSDGSMISR